MDMFSECAIFKMTLHKALREVLTRTTPDWLLQGIRPGLVPLTVVNDALLPAEPLGFIRWGRRHNNWRIGSAAPVFAAFGRMIFEFIFVKGGISPRLGMSEHAQMKEKGAWAGCSKEAGCGGFRYNSVTELFFFLSRTNAFPSPRFGCEKVLAA